MKNVTKLLWVLCILMLPAQLSLAADRVWSSENFDAKAANRLLICPAKYSQGAGEVTAEQMQEIFYQQGKESKLYVLTPEDVKRNILRDASIDLTALEKTDPEKAAEVFQSEMHKYVDAYLVATVVHNSRIAVFYDLFAPGTTDMLYSYQIVASSSADDNSKTYEKLTDSFYKNLQDAKKVKKQK